MRKNFLSFILVTVLVLGLFLAPVSVSARGLGKADKNRIECAKEKMRILAEMFDVKLPLDKKTQELPAQCSNAGAVVKPPKWFVEGQDIKTKDSNGQIVTVRKEAELDRMDKTKVVYIPGEGTYSEADLWRQAFSNVYLYLDRAAMSMDPSQPISLDQLARGYVGNRINLVATLDRLNKDLLFGSKPLIMKDSMDGRGRAMLATLELINNEFFSTIESFSAPSKERENKYRQAVQAVVVLSNQLYTEFMSSAVPTFPPDPKTLQTTAADKMMFFIMLIIGSALAGLSVFLFLEVKRQSIEIMVEEYHTKSVAWAEDFNRQFLTIDIRYIVFGTIGIFALLGLFFGFSTGGFSGVFVFLVFVAIGVFASIRMPEAVLDSLKKARGRKINAQLMDALILLSNSLRSGMDIVQGFEKVSSEMRPPISDEFGLVIKNYQLGTPFEKALDGMNDRIDSRMLSYIIKAIVIQRQVGGNLTVIFARLVENIREESKLEEKLQAMTAQQKIQAIVVGVMPFLMVGVMFLFRPDEMISFYASPLGMILFLFCVVWIAIGMKIIKKVGEVKV
ncbi:type II secretion system F family protein [Candidatus Avelusimicrobium aviculae]|uniref:type II secretion system F family protein n=1 Tax=Candidatus Avelusimicrobium aviculae TaxID=3416206 RepID=UPI003D0F1578